MPTIEVVEQHSLESRVVLHRINEAIIKLQTKYADDIEHPSFNWSHGVEYSVLKFYLVADGHAVSGTLTIAPSRVTVVIKLPLIGIFVRRQIEDEALKRLEELLQ